MPNLVTPDEAEGLRDVLGQDPNIYESAREDIIRLALTVEALYPFLRWVAKQPCDRWDCEWEGRHHLDCLPAKARKLLERE